MRHHETRPPSSFPMKSICNHYVSGPAGQAAERGTAQHEAIEQAFKGLPITGDFAPAEIEDMEWAYRAIISIFDGYAINPGEIQSEVEVTITDADLNELTFGTVDAGGIFDGVRNGEPAKIGIVVDYKSGEIRNYREQMEAYSVGWMQKTGAAECDAFIVYGRKRKTARYHFEFESALKNVVALCFKIDNPSAPFRCEYCSWCKNAGECPAVTGAIQEIMALNNDSTKFVSPAAATPKELSAMKLLSETINAWVERIEAEVKARLVAGQEVPGYKLQKRTGAAFVTDIQKAVELIKLPVPAFLAACSVSIPKLSDEYSKCFGASKKRSREKVEEVLKDVVANKADSFAVIKDGE